MNDMTPERLRARNRDEYSPQYFEIEAAASAWEADREQLRLAIVDQANTEAELNEMQVRCESRQISRQNGGIPGAPEVLESRIEELERERDHYRSNVDRWAEEIATRDARIEALKETDAGKLQAEVDGTIRVQMSYIATLEASIEALKKAAREYADAVIEGNATLGQQKRLHDLLDQKGRPR